MSFMLNICSRPRDARNTRPTSTLPVRRRASLKAVASATGPL